MKSLLLTSLLLLSSVSAFAGEDCKSTVAKIIKNVASQNLGAVELKSMKQIAVLPLQDLSKRIVYQASFDLDLVYNVTAETWTRSSKQGCLVTKIELKSFNPHVEDGF